MNSFYDISRIKLNDEYFSDSLMLALAWKRASAYIRQHNWYADNFDLDKSSVLLRQKCQEWAEKLQEDAPAMLLEPLRLVPAPKSGYWEFVPDENTEKLVWMPAQRQETDIVLRPLAHLGIKEQTFFTLLMSCLANIVETKQGDPATPFEQVHEQGVVSYGNRLYCEYDDDGNAWHNYGATTIYSKYFADYRRFLRRPYYFCNKYQTEKPTGNDIYIFEIDLERFYDRVDRNKLIKKIHQLMQKQNHGEFFERSDSDAIVKKFLGAFKDWGWEKGTDELYNQLCTDTNKEQETGHSECAPKGIPQGLVAGGFLANIYLLEVDEDISSLLHGSASSEKNGTLKEPLEADNLHKKNNSVQALQIIKNGFKENGFILLDYCRYADDMRFVVSAPSLNSIDNGRQGNSEEKLEALKVKFHALIAAYLNKKELGLKPNESKTKVTLYRGVPRGISSQLNEIQAKVSGPLSPEQVDSLIGELENLLQLSPVSESEVLGGNFRNRLAEIEHNMFDLAEGTIRRFAANKLAQQLQEKRHFTSRAVDGKGNPVPGDWDFVQERVARHLIAVWSKEPSLVLLLKKGLELFPDPRLLTPILEQMNLILDKSCTSNNYERQKAIMRYCLAEIFRHSATVIHKKDAHAIPAQANRWAYFERLQDQAASILNQPEVLTGSETSSCKRWFLLDQARFLLLVRQDTILQKSMGDAGQDLIFQLIKGFRTVDISDDDIANFPLYILLADQLTDDKAPLLRAVCCALETLKTKDALKTVQIIATQNAELAAQIMTRLRASAGMGNTLSFSSDFKKLANIIYLDAYASKTPLSEITGPQSLAQLFLRMDNPFAHEIMAIRLMKCLILKLQEELSREDNSFQSDWVDRQIDLSKTLIYMEGGYANPPTYESFDCPFKVQTLAVQKALCEDWSYRKENKGGLQQEALYLRKIAIVIRAALSGSLDGTGYGQPKERKKGYSGLTASLARREISLYTSPEALAGEGAPVSGWLTTLLSRLLRWPGIRVNDQGYTWPQKLNLQTVKRLLQTRLDKLRSDYCQLSQMPILTELITPEWEGKKSLKVVMVQSKLPAQADFFSDIYLEDHQYRAKHRRHIASVAQLVLQNIEAQKISAVDEGAQKNSSGNNNQAADLIIWPELAVHRDDLDILKLLSQKTHAIIFAGLVFLENSGGKPFNTALWIVPRKHNGNENEIMRFQGKQHLTKAEKSLDVKPWRPYQLRLELRHPDFPQKPGFMLTGAICLDATDIKLSADLANKSNAFVIAAMNKDVNTFDSMVEALHYHMYQHVVLVNTGEFGGSCAMAPYRERYNKLITHNMGKQQVAVSSFEMNMFDFRRDGVGKSHRSGIETKTVPAGIQMS